MPRLPILTIAKLLRMPSSGLVTSAGCAKSIDRGGLDGGRGLVPVAGTRYDLLSWP
jgi:hypothetical protein